MVGNYKLKEINSENIDQYEKEWNSFIEQHPKGTFFHTTYHLKFLELNGREIQSYIFFGEDGEIRGIFPIVKEKFFFLERYKSPGFIGNIPFDEILPMVKKYFSKRAVYLILNFPDYTEEPKENEVCTFMLDIAGKTIGDIWKSDLERSARRKVKKAMENKLDVLISNSKKELREFYSVYVERIKRFGTKPYSFESFNFLREKSQNFWIINAYYKEKIIAGAIVVLYQDILLNPFAASKAEYLKFAPNNLIYWKMIEFGVEKKCKLVDYGPSTLGDGVSKFKRSMGGKAVPYEEHIILNKFLFVLLQRSYKPLSRLKKFFHR